MMRVPGNFNVMNKEIIIRSSSEMRWLAHNGNLCFPYLRCPALLHYYLALSCACHNLLLYRVFPKEKVIASLSCNVSEIG